MDEINQASQGDNMAAETEGWLTTIGHPANRSASNSPIPEEGIVLGSGFDGLTMSMAMEWQNLAFFHTLDRLKEGAVAQDLDMPGVFRPPNGADPWFFNVAPYGSKGYTWLLWNPEFYVKLTSAQAPGARPNATIEVRSETLWRYGPVEAVGRIIELFEQAGARTQPPKASMADLCVDFLLREDLWKTGLIDHAVSRAVYDAVHRFHRKTTGFTIGKGNLMARLYDKALEIRTQSKKYWMYEIWKIPVIPEGAKGTRMEFQVRREALMELGIDTVWDLFDHPGNLWSYLTNKWLKFQDDPQQDFRWQNPLPFWRTVQNGFLGMQGRNPLIRAQAVQSDKKKIAQQLMGQLTSLIAIDDETGDITPGLEVDLTDHLQKVIDSARLLELSPKDLGEKVRRKLCRYARRTDKYEAAQKERKALGFPVKE